MSDDIIKKAFFNEDSESFSCGTVYDEVTGAELLAGKCPKCKTGDIVHIPLPYSSQDMCFNCKQCEENIIVKDIAFGYNILHNLREFRRTDNTT